MDGRHCSAKAMRTHSCVRVIHPSLLCCMIGFCLSTLCNRSVHACLPQITFSIQSFRHLRPFRLLCQILAFSSLSQPINLKEESICQPHSTVTWHVTRYSFYFFPNRKEKLSVIRLRFKRRNKNTCFSITHHIYMRCSYAGEIQIKELSSCALAFLLQNAEPINRGDIVKYMARQTSEVVRVTMDVCSPPRIGGGSIIALCQLMLLIGFVIVFIDVSPFQSHE